MLTRFDPLRELGSLVPDRAGPGRVDVVRRGDEVVVEMDMPGVSRDDVEVTLEGGVLEVSARRSSSFESGDAVLVAERPHGSVRRRLHLGERLDASATSASLDDGVLRVVVPLAEDARSTRVQVGSGSAAAEVGAGG